MKTKLLAAIASVTVLGGCSAVGFGESTDLMQSKAYQVVQASEGTTWNRIEGANWMCAYVMKETDDQEGEDFFNNENLELLERMNSKTATFKGQQSGLPEERMHVTMKDAYSSFDSFFDGSERRNQLFLDIWDDCDSLRASR